MNMLQSYVMFCEEYNAILIQQLEHHLNPLSIWLIFCIFASQRNMMLDFSLMAQNVTPSCSQPKPLHVLSHHNILVIINVSKAVHVRKVQWEL